MNAFGTQEGAANQRPSAMLLWIWGTSLALLYVLTLRPTIAWYDTPEFADVAYTLGIPHPPGSPTYVLLANLMTLIPLGAVAVRVNLLSSVCATLACVFLALCLAEIHGRWGGTPSGGRLAGILAATLLAVSPTFWGYATQGEVYAVFAWVVSLIVWLAVRWCVTQDDRYLFGCAFVLGLSGGVHGTSVFFLPAFALMVLTGLPRGRGVRTLLLVALFGGLGASVYLYLPLRAGTEPPINWGHPDSWARFWNLVSDRKDSSFHFTDMARPLWPYVRQFMVNLNAEMTPVGWLGAIAGIAILLARSIRIGLFTILFCSGNLLFFLFIWTIPDAYLPTFFFVALWCGIGLGWLVDRRAVALRFAAVLACLALILEIAAQTRGGAIRALSRADGSGRRVAEENLLPLPPDAIVFATANWFAFRYLQDVEGMRPDVSILLVSDLTTAENFTPVTAERFPKLAFPATDPRQVRWDVYFQALLRANLPRAPVYWEPLGELNQNVYAYLRPWRYLWRFDASGKRSATAAEGQTYFEDMGRFLREELSLSESPGRPARHPGTLLDQEALRYHGYMLTASAGVFKLQGRPRDAVRLLDLAVRLSPEDATVANALGEAYGLTGRWDDAERMFRRAASLTPGNATYLLNVAILKIGQDKYDAARRIIAEAIAINSRAAEPFYQLSVLERKQGRHEPARKALLVALSRTDDRRFVRAWRKELGALDAGIAPGLNPIYQ